jgi:AraC-like DNA-binding protein
MPPISPAPSSRFHFDTAALPGDDRLAMWREVFGRQVTRLDIAPLESDAPYRSELVALQLPDLSISYCDYENVRSERTNELTTDGSHDLIFGFIESGSVRVAQLDRALCVEAGCATMLWSAEGNRAVAPLKTQLFNLLIPRPVLAARVRDIQGHLARQVTGDVIALRLLRHYVRSLYDSTDAQLTPQFIQTARNHVYDLVALAIDATGDVAELARQGGLAAGRLQDAKDYACANRHRPGLSLDEIAQRQRVSPRYLRMLFETAGTSFSQFLREHRLQHSCHRLTSPLYAELPISTIAYEAGFGDLSNFNRAFRARYGLTPPTFAPHGKIAWTRPRSLRGALTTKS